MPGKTQHNVPSKVDEVAHAIERDQPGMPSSTAHRIGWKMEHKEKGTKSKGPKQPLTGYGKAAADLANEVSKAADKKEVQQVSNVARAAKAKAVKQAMLIPNVVTGFVEKCASLGLSESEIDFLYMNAFKGVK